VKDSLMGGSHGVECAASHAKTVPGESRWAVAALGVDW
jgi:hypothetical protein